MRFAYRAPMRLSWLIVVGFVAAAYAEETTSLIAKLSDPKVDVRVSAAQALEKSADPARLGPLENAATTDAEPRVRLQALKALGPEHVGQDAKWKALRIKALQDKEPSVRGLAASQLKGQAEAIAPILAALQDERDYNYRNQMIVALDEHDRRVVDYYLSILPVKAGRALVLDELSRSGDPRVVEPLIKAARDHYQNAVSAMARTEDPRTLAVLAELVADPDDDTAREAIGELAYHPDRRAVAPLLARWKKLDGKQKQISQMTQNQLSEAFGDRGEDVPGFELSTALRAIARVDPAPCEARKAATGDVRAYLAAILPATCGTPTIGEILKLVGNQLDALGGKKPLTGAFTVDAMVAILPTVGTSPADAIKALGETGSRSNDGEAVVTVAADGTSAVLSFVPFIDGRTYRASELVVKTAAGWRVAAAMWSRPQPNDVVNKAARANTQLAFTELKGLGPADQGLEAAFLDLQRGTLDKDAAARKDLLAIGSGPGERTVGGGLLATAWTAAWSKRSSLANPLIAKLAPSGNTGWVIADVILDKAKPVKYAIRFRLFLMFDKTPAGAWSLVHAHFAVAPPS
jgi:ketosteroid isomerase-like protein